MEKDVYSLKARAIHPFSDVLSYRIFDLKQLFQYCYILD